ncbi:hypothetical protein GCM10011320_13230 [Neoroseomonas lacus]|uniref:Uncharacterized protein n=1 Tax=Neoroseomonas lacus TaxID=287609 RepID=A0A917KD71_9PROT|nr:hypothetical protein GCM10011320_13230 [Neoroseomonas lacus]
MIAGRSCGVRRDRQRPAHADMLALVVGVADVGLVGEAPALLVEQQRVRVPSVPQRVAGSEHLVGHVVALVLRSRPSRPQFSASTWRAVVTTFHAGRPVLSRSIEPR